MSEVSAAGRLTVIVPHYNSPQTLIRLIQSIPDQDWIEIVVVDDNSSDPLPSLDAIYPRVRVFSVPQGRKGGGAARNVGLQNSQSDWVLFADADDLFVAGAFEQIERYRHSDLDAVYFAPTSMKEKTGGIGERHLHYKGLLEKYARTSDKSMLYKYFVPWSKLVSRRLIDAHSISFDEVIASNDMNFSLKVAFYSNRLAVDMAPIYCVTESEQSLTKQTSLAVLESRFYAVVRYNQFLKSHGKGEHQIGINLQIYNMRRLGFLTVMKYLGYALKTGMPLQRGLKHLAMQIRKDMRAGQASI